MLVWWSVRGVAVTEMYTIGKDLSHNDVAICLDNDEFQQAVSDKEKNPSLTFNKVQLILPSGTKWGSLMWQNNRWC